MIRSFSWVLSLSVPFSNLFLLAVFLPHLFFLGRTKQAFSYCDTNAYGVTIQNIAQEHKNKDRHQTKPNKDYYQPNQRSGTIESLTNQASPRNSSNAKDTTHNTTFSREANLPGKWAFATMLAERAFSEGGSSLRPDMYLVLVCALAIQLRKLYPAIPRLILVKSPVHPWTKANLKRCRFEKIIPANFTDARIRDPWAFSKDKALKEDLQGDFYRGFFQRVQDFLSGKSTLDQRSPYAIKGCKFTKNWIYADQTIKFHLWSLTEYERIIYFFPQY